MKVLYYVTADEVYWYWTDQTQPRPRGKYIGGLAFSLQEVKQSVSEYLGSNEFELQLSPHPLVPAR
jgi:hypothetical protein